MNSQELLDLIALGEGQTVEFKTSFASQNEAIETLCAFRNAEGGRVLFGVAPDGTVKGVTLGANTLEAFATRVRENSEPRMHPTIDSSITIDGMQIVVMSVDKLVAAVQYAFQKPLIRVGRANHLMSAQRQKEIYDLASQAFREQERSPIRIRRVKENILTYLPRLASGRDIFTVAGAAFAFSLEHDELESDDEVALVGGFLQEIFDWCEVYNELEPADRVRATFELNGRIRTLEEAGFLVFGGREVQRIEGGVWGAEDWPVAIVRVVRSGSPDVAKVELSHSCDTPRDPD